MSLFGKKYLYKIVWAYSSITGCPHTEIIKAKDPSHAWKKIKKEHCYPITLISLEIINMNKLGGKVD